MAKTQTKTHKSAVKARAAKKPAAKASRAKVKVVARAVGKSAAKRAPKSTSRPKSRVNAKPKVARPKAAKAKARVRRPVAKPATRVSPKVMPPKPAAKPASAMPSRPQPVPRPVVVKAAPPSLPARPAPPKPGPKPVVVKVAPMKPVPVEKIVLPSAKEYAEMRVRLEQKRQEILASYKRDLRVGQEANDEPTEDIVDRANNAYHRELMFSLSDSERQLLLQVEAALSRFELGNFGACVHCGDPIALPRLQALPWARLCINCQELAEKGLLDDN